MKGLLVHLWNMSCDWRSIIFLESTISPTRPCMRHQFKCRHRCKRNTGNTVKNWHPCDAIPFKFVYLDSRTNEGIHQSGLCNCLEFPNCISITSGANHFLSGSRRTEEGPRCVCCEGGFAHQKELNISCQCEARHGGAGPAKTNEIQKKNKPDMTRK